MIIVNSGQNPIDPEPCDDCDLGIMYILGYDGIRRCKNCIQELSRLKGWDKEDEAYFAAWEEQKKAKAEAKEDPDEPVPVGKSFPVLEQTGLFEVEEEEQALGNYPRPGTVKEKILVFIARQRDDGATDDEAALLLQQAVTTVSANRNQLLKAGWVKDSGRRRKIRSGNLGTVWTLTEQAKKELIK